MRWIKKGLIFVPNGKTNWMQTHAALPLVDKLSNDIYRIFFSSRDSKNKASIGYLEVDINAPKKILNISKSPVITIGPLGSFDESGVMASSIVNYQNKKYLYYIGWNQGVTVPFRWSIGLALSSDDGKTFKKYTEGPILDRNTVDPYAVASPTVIFENDLWRMWYLSGLKWEKSNVKPTLSYNIRYAESKDGINWNRKGIVILNHKKNESRFSRISILKENEIFKAWYAYANGHYRIGYAESKDGKIWQRKDEDAGIDVSESGWDSEMIEYPYVFEHNGTKYMLYNGNDYGKTGFGYAVLE